MTYLLDSTVLVDVGRRHGPTLAWLPRQRASTLHLPTITVGELVRGIHHRHGHDALYRARHLGQLAREIDQMFPGRLLPFDRVAAEIWGRLMGEGAARGRTPPSDDAKIAAIALRHGLTVATSNTRDFAPLVATVDPRTA